MRDLILRVWDSIIENKLGYLDGYGSSEHKIRTCSSKGSDSEPSAAMASLSTASFLTQETPAGLWRGEKKLFLSASSQTQAAPSSSNTTSRRKPADGSLCASSFGSMSPPSSCRSRRLLLLLLPAASKRTSEKRKSVVDEPFQYEGEEDDGDADEEYVLPELPGEERDFWEGPQFEVLGFIIQYLWAIGIVVALVGCFIAVKSYNEGATDFKETKVYKESMESQGFLESPSDSKVFDEPPQDAPPVAK